MNSIGYLYKLFILINILVFLPNNIGSTKICIWDNQFKLIISTNLFLHTSFYRDVEPKKRDISDLCEVNKSLQDGKSSKHDVVYKNSRYSFKVGLQTFTYSQNLCSIGGVGNADKAKLKKLSIKCEPVYENIEEEIYKGTIDIVTGCKAVVETWWTTEDDERNLNPWPLFIRLYYLWTYLKLICNIFMKKVENCCSCACNYCVWNYWANK